MIRQDYLLMMLAAGEGEPFPSSHIQKSMFLLSKQIILAIQPELCYSFEAWDYGPYDKQIYDDIHDFERQKLVYALNGYAVTVKGWKKGMNLLTTLPENEQEFIRKIAKFVLDLSFTQLNASVRKAYPEMYKNAVFSGDNNEKETVR